MALPQELQDIVYDELWEEDGHMVLAPTSLKERWPDRPPGRVLLDYGQPAGYYHIGLPQWLMTNVAMFQKGLKQLLTKSTLAWNETQMRRQNKLKPSPWLDFSSCTHYTPTFNSSAWAALVMSSMTASRNASNSWQSFSARI
jgi:hypothetical protein